MNFVSGLRILKKGKTYHRLEDGRFACTLCPKIMTKQPTASMHFKTKHSQEYQEYRNSYFPFLPAS